MRYEILGPLAVEVAGSPLRIRSGRVSALLATLLLEANRTVPTERLIEAVWDRHAPATARSQLTIVVSQLRRLLARAGAPSPVVVTEAAGYRLRAAADEIDALLFEERAAEAERAEAAGRPVEAVERLRSALGLWRGPALAGVDGQVVRSAATLLAERRAAVQARCIELDFALGRHGALVTELVGLVAADPFNERLQRSLIVALYRSGRVTEALAAFQEFRRRLTDEFGIEPSPELTALHRQILNRDPALDPPCDPPADPSTLTEAVGRTGPGRRPGGPPGQRRAGGRPRRRPGRRSGGQPGGPAHRRPGGRDGSVPPSGAAEAVRVVPRQLPPAVADFVGREPELAQIHRAVHAGAARPGPAVVVISGLPGVGKSALVIRAGGQLGGEHPDGCLYAELVDGRGTPVDPHDVLGAFLHALGVPDRCVPAGRTERAALYRSIVAERRLLVVLDGAGDEGQVRPLLPTGPGSAALITARRPLTGLDGAHLIALDMLPVEPAVRLLTGMLPASTVDDVPAARRVVQFCDGLPLAIRVTGNRLAVRVERSLAQSAERLADGTRRLDRLAVGDRDVRRGLAGAYQRLDPYAGTLLRRLGSLPVADFPGWLAEPLLDVDRATAALALAELADAGLVRPAPGRSATGAPRYRMPELIRLYARERAGVDDPAPLRGTAHRRAYWWLLELALRADGGAPDPVFPTGDLGPPAGSGAPAELLRAVDDDPVGWLAAERSLVVGAAGHAATLGETELAWRLAVAPTNFFRRRGQTELWQRALDHGRRATRHRPDPARAGAILSLSQALLLLSRAETTAAWAMARTVRRCLGELGDQPRVAACASVQSLAARRMAPLDPLLIEQGADDTGRPAFPGGMPRRARVAWRATPAQRSADRSAAVPIGSVQHTPEVVPVFAGQLGAPDPALARGE